MERERIFLIGNGPSLNETNLELLIGEENWAMNRIHKLYTGEWRPTRWWWSDHPQHHRHLGEIFMYVNSYIDHQCWIRRDVAEMLTGDYRPFGNEWPFFEELPDHVYVWDYCIEHNAACYGDHRFPEHLHFLEPVEGYASTLCKPDTGIIALAEQAIIEGYTEIYYIGTDLGITDDIATNHFAEDYALYNHLPTPGSAATLNASIHAAHELIAEYADHHGINVYNATIGGELEAYERVDYESLFDK